MGEKNPAHDAKKRKSLRGESQTKKNIIKKKRKGRGVSAGKEESLAFAVAGVMRKKEDNLPSTNGNEVLQGIHRRQCKGSLRICLATGVVYWGREKSRATWGKNYWRRGAGTGKRKKSKVWADHRSCIPVSLRMKALWEGWSRSARKRPPRPSQEFVGRVGDLFKGLKRCAGGRKQQGKVLLFSGWMSDVARGP